MGKIENGEVKQPTLGDIHDNWASKPFRFRKGDWQQFPFFWDTSQDKWRVRQEVKETKTEEEAEEMERKIEEETDLALAAVERYKEKIKSNRMKKKC
jgi:hypothetical protein